MYEYRIAFPLYCECHMRLGSSLGHYATCREFTGLIPNIVFGIFHWYNTFGRTMALGSNQPLTEMSNTIISLVVKESRLTTLSLSCMVCLEIPESQHPGTLRSFQAFNEIFLYIVANDLCRSRKIICNYAWYSEKVYKFYLKNFHFGNKSSIYYHKCNFGLQESADNIVSF